MMTALLVIGLLVGGTAILLAVACLGRAARQMQDYDHER